MTDAPIFNRFGESLDECVARFRRTARADFNGLSKKEQKETSVNKLAQQMAWSVMLKLPRRDKAQRDFYSRVHAYFSEG